MSPAPSASPGPDAAAARARRDRRVVIIALAVALPFLLLVIGVIAGVVFYMLKSSDAYKLAEGVIRESDDIKAIVGDRLEFGWFPTGSMQTSGGGGGHGELAIRVKGPAGSTTVYVSLRRQHGRWQIIEATYEGRDGTLRRLTTPGRVLAPGRHARKATA